MEDGSPVPIAQRSSHRWSTPILGCAVALSLVIGLAYIRWLQPLAVDERTDLYLRHYPGVSGRGLLADEFQYLSIAKCISTGAGYSLAPGEPTAIRVPGYPLYNAALFRIFGSSLTVALLGNVFLVALLPALTFALSNPAFGCKTAVVAAFFCALDPGLYYFVLGEAMSEALFTVLLCTAIVMWQKAQTPYAYKGWRTDQGGASNGTTQPLNLPVNLPENRVTFLFALAAGTLFGAACLTRTGFIALPLFIVLMELVVRRHKLSLKKAIVFGLAFVVTLCPWALRNRAVMGKLMFSTTNDGVTLLGTVLAAQQHRGDWIDPEFVAPEYARVREMPDPIQRDRAETRLAIAELKKTSPVTLLQVAVKRVLRLWVPLNRIVSDKAGFKANLAVNVFYFPAMLLAALGLWKARHNPAMVPLWTTCLYLTLLAAVSWGGTRIRYPIEPFLAIFAAHGLLEMLKFSSVRLRGTSA
jgi:4-amino-4-deoxy-L-arabinose transferase-like glycosyltransferase